MRNLLAAAAVLFLAACEPEPTAIRFDHESLVVQGVISAGDTTAMITVFHVGTADFWNVHPGGRGVADAVVLLTQAADTFAFVHVPGAQCRFSAAPPPVELTGCYYGRVPGGVQPDTRYDLLVRVGGTVVRGSTMVPGTPVLSDPAEGRTILAPRLFVDSAVDPVVVRWEGVAAGARAELNLRPRVQECGLTLRVGPVLTSGTVSVSGSGSLAMSVVHLGCSVTVDQDTLPAVVTVSAFDENYTHYIRSRTDGAVRHDDAASGLTGAYGVFGAVASTQRGVTLVRPAQ